MKWECRYDSLCVAAWSGSITIICFVLQHGVGTSLSFAFCFNMELECHYHLLCVTTWSGSIAIKCFVFSKWSRSMATKCFMFQHGVRASLSFALCCSMEWERHFNRPKYLHWIRKQAVTGELRPCRFRSICWRVSAVLLVVQICFSAQWNPSLKC